MTAPGHLVAVCVGQVREVPRGNGTVTTAIWKEPVAGRVPVRGVNLGGDDQADRTVHGGPDKAVYAYGAQDTARWEAELQRELGPGAFGENLTVGDLDVSAALVGERWEVGSTLLEVTQPRVPCFKLGLRMGDPGFLKLFARASRPGAYLRILREGDVGAGDAVTVVHRPAHAVTMRLMSDALLKDHALLPRVLEAPELMPSWREWIEERVG